MIQEKSSATATRLVHQKYVDRSLPSQKRELREGRGENRSQKGEWGRNPYSRSAEKLWWNSKCHTAETQMQLIVYVGREDHTIKRKTPT
jgi:hypothetical protein